MEHAGNQLRTEIKKRGLTQGEAAEKLGITRQTIGQWLKRPVFDANTLHEISSKLGVELGTEAEQKLDNISLPREVFNELSLLIETISSQQGTISHQHQMISHLVKENQRLAASTIYPNTEDAASTPIVSDVEGPYQK